MKTRTEGRCVWLREAIQAGEEDCPPLQGDQKADVCIVGGGLAGLWTALHLKKRQPTLDVAIVEADISGGGASGRNSGMVLAQWAKFQALEAFCGTADAIRLGHAFGNSASNIEAFCKEHGIDAETMRAGGCSGGIGGHLAHRVVVLWQPQECDWRAFGVKLVERQLLRGRLIGEGEAWQRRAGADRH